MAIGKNERERGSQRGEETQSKSPFDRERIANASVAAHNYHHTIIIHSINESNKKRHSPFINIHTHTCTARKRERALKIYIERKKTVTVAISTSFQPLFRFIWQSTHSHSLSTIEQHWANDEFEWNEQIATAPNWNSSAPMHDRCECWCWCTYKNSKST